jgi:hypothetical protein
MLHMRLQVSHSRLQPAPMLQQAPCNAATITNMQQMYRQMKKTAAASTLQHGHPHMYAATALPMHERMSAMLQQQSCKINSIAATSIWQLRRPHMHAPIVQPNPKRCTTSSSQCRGPHMHASTALPISNIVALLNKLSSGWHACSNGLPDNHPWCTVVTSPSHQRHVKTVLPNHTKTIVADL